MKKKAACLLAAGLPDYQVLCTYLTDFLGGAVGDQYAGPQGRIAVA